MKHVPVPRLLPSVASSASCCQNTVLVPYKSHMPAARQANNFSNKPLSSGRGWQAAHSILDTRNQHLWQALYPVCAPAPAHLLQSCPQRGPARSWPHTWRRPHQVTHWEAVHAAAAHPAGAPCLCWGEGRPEAAALCWPNPARNK